MASQMFRFEVHLFGSQPRSITERGTIWIRIWQGRGIYIRFTSFIMGLLHDCPASMMTSSNEIMFRVTGPLWGKSNGHLWIRWIPHRKIQWCGALMLSLICVYTNGWANNRSVGNLGRHRAPYDFTVMQWCDSERYETNTIYHIWSPMSSNMFLTFP